MGLSSMKADLVTQFPTKGQEMEPMYSRNPYREAAPRPPVDPIAIARGAADLIAPADEPQKRIAMLDIDENWPASVSRDEPEKLSAETRSHTFFVRTKRHELLTNIDVLGFIAKCPDAGDGQGVVVHRDVILSLAHHLLDKVHELEQLRKEEKTGGEPRYDEKLSAALDKLGDKDAEIKELRAALGEATVKIRRLESKLFK